MITQMEPIAVIFTLPEDSLPAVNSRDARRRTLAVKAMSRDNGTQSPPGTLLTIDNQIDQTTGTVQVEGQSSIIRIALCGRTSSLMPAC